MTDQLNLDQPNTLPSEDGDSTPTPAKPRDHAHLTSPTAGAGSQREVHVLDYVRVLYKRRYLALTVFTLIVVWVTVYTYSVTPIFEARTKLLIESENPNVTSFKEVLNEQQAKADYYQTQYNILQSRSLARKTIDDLKLGTNEKFVGAPGPKRWTVRSAVSGALTWVKNSVSGEPEVSENAIPAVDETAAQSRLIDSFLSGVTVTPVRNSRLVDLKYRSTDPTLAMQIVNAMAKNYITQNLEYKFLASKEAADFLSGQLAEQRKEVEAADQRLQAYRERNDSISLEDRQNIVVQKLEDLNAAVTRAKTIRIEKEALYNQLRASQNNPATLDSFPAILTNSFVQQLKAQLADLQRQRAQLSEKLGDQHPQMVTVTSAIQNTQVKLDAEIRKVVQSVKSDFDSVSAQEQSLVAALNQQKSEAMSMNRKSIDYNVLDRDAKSSKLIYDSLMQRAKETGVTGELRSSNIRVLDIAERPRGAVFPNKSQNMVLGLFGGALTALLLVFAFEYFDSRIKTPEEIKTYLGLPHLGLLPLMAKGEGGDSNGYVVLDGAVPANFSEAFRVLRTNVLFSSAEAGGQSILVTSTGPGEGKSMVAANLAVSLAQASKRVLLIDADMRKPKVNRIFDLPEEPGLSNLLVGNSKASESVRKSRVPGLWVLTSGRIPPNPAELLGSQRFKDFLGSLKTHFDWVVIDSPPVMAVADASVVAHATTGVLFVIGTEMTSRHAARRAVEQLETSQGRFFGAVLNRVDLERNAYYYSQYYRREYTTYYTKT